jgi:hypothetical protein
MLTTRKLTKAEMEKLESEIYKEGSGDTWVDCEAALEAHKELKVWQVQQPRLKLWMIWDQLRICSLMARSATGHADPSLVRYLMERIHKQE